jgi:serine/threonine-protein kinase
VPVVEGVWRGEGNVGLATAQYAVSQTGTLVYVPGPTGSAEYQRQLVSIDRDGKITPLKMRPGLYESPRISPDGSRVAVLMSAGNQSNVYVYDLTGGTTMRQLTFEGRNRFPIWTPDGKRIVFQSDRGGDLGIWWQQADGLGVAERLTKAENGAAHIPEAFVARTNTFSFSDVRSPNSVMLRLFSIDAHKTETFDDVRSTSPLDSDFSPDGQWVAYTVRGKDAGGVAGANVWVQPVPPTGAKYLVSSAGGHHPQWSADGTHLLYLPGADPLVTVTVTTRNGFAVGEPTPVPGGFASNTSSLSGRNHDLSRVGSFIVAALAAGGTRPQRIDVVLNWFTELQQRVPTR